MQYQFRYVLLTYAQCGSLDAFRVVEHLSELGAECIIGRENHEDGGVHLHAFVDFGRKFRSRDVRVFDVDGQHPNVSPSKGTPEKGYDYAVKDGDIVAGGLERPNRSRVPGSGDQWATILGAGDIDEFWKLCEELAPRALLTNFTSLRCFAEWRFRRERLPYITPRGITFETAGVAGLDSWVRENLGNDTSGGESSYTSLRLQSLRLHAYHRR